MLPLFPTWAKGQDVQKRLQVIEQYIINLRNDIEEEINSITYENLDPSLRKRFTDIQDGLLAAQMAISTTDQNVTANYISDIEGAEAFATKDTVENLTERVVDLEDDHVSEQDLTNVTDRVTTLENDIGALEDIDAGTRLDNLEAIDADTRLDALEEFKPKAVTTENTETIIADKNLKVASIKIGNNTYTEQTATISGTTIHFLGY